MENPMDFSFAPLKAELVVPEAHPFFSDLFFRAPAKNQIAR